MNIERARKLTRGSAVSCPADRGEAAYQGTVTSIQPDAPASQTGGVEYIWVEVQGPTHKSVWPSNRLA